MMIDASAIVAPLTREPEADALIDRLDKVAQPVTSAIAVFEATLGLCRKHHVSAEEAGADVEDFLRIGRIGIVPSGAEEASIALTTFATARKAAIRHSAIRAIASPAPWRSTVARGCCSRGTIS